MENKIKKKNCLVTVFSDYFLFSKIIFYFLDKKTCLVSQNGQKTKTVFKAQFVKKTEKIQKVVFSF